MSGFKGQLNWDETSADTIAASDTVGSIIRASGASVSSTLVSGKQALDVYVANTLGINVDLTAAGDSVTAWLADGAGNAISSTTGSLNVNVTGGSITVSDVTLANTAIENTAKSVTSTTGALLTSQLSGRKYLFVQNRGSVNGFIGKVGVTTANGFEVGKNVALDFRLGAAVSLHAVTAAGTADFRMMEFS